MRKSVEVIYENGVLRPVEPLELSEQQRLRVTLEAEADWLDTAYMAWCAREADARVTLEAVRQALAKIPASLTADFMAERDDR
jgi:predicted DNA-binding antitoxin AbrB/MazE fold protein